MKSSKKPLARTEALVIQQVDEELLVYDLNRHRAHCLNPAAAYVWGECDGARTVEEIAERAGDRMPRELRHEWVRLALKQLEKSHLLATDYGFASEIPAISRREMASRLGWGAAIAVVPLVTSVLAPTALAAASCTQAGQPCTTSIQCCTGVCLPTNVCA